MVRCSAQVVDGVLEWPIDVPEGCAAIEENPGSRQRSDLPRVLKVVSVKAMSRAGLGGAILAGSCHTMSISLQALESADLLKTHLTSMSLFEVDLPRFGRHLV